MEKPDNKNSHGGSKGKGNEEGKNGGEKKTPPKSLYERVVGKSLVTNDVKRSSVKTALINWFAKESAEERAFRSTLKSYRNKLVNEMQQITKAVQRHQRRYHEQRAEFDKQEKQLIAWGLKGAIQKFHMQAWFRLERCKLQEKITIEIEKIVIQRQNRSLQYLQSFEETDNRKDKFSKKEADEFCQSPEALIMLDSVVVDYHERLKKLDLLCTYATRQFLLLEPEFAWKDTKKRTKILHTILLNYNNLPQVNALDNIETDLTWEYFCMWCAVRAHKLKQIEQDYSDFIEDQRELEGRLFFRWHSSVMLTIKTPDQVVPAVAQRESTDGADPEHLKSRPTALRVTPASIKAFVRYFATEIIGVKYEIPKDYINASIALTESLFFRRLAPYVFRYVDKLQREKDEYWRIHCQKCRYVSPSVYSVPEKYFRDKNSRSEEKEKPNDTTLLANSPISPNFPHHNHVELYRASSILEQERIRNSVEFPSFSSFQKGQKNLQLNNHQQPSTNNSTAASHTPFHPSANSFILSPPSRDSEFIPGAASATVSTTSESANRGTNSFALPSKGVSPVNLFTPDDVLKQEKVVPLSESADHQDIGRLSYDEHELQFPIDVNQGEGENSTIKPASQALKDSNEEEDDGGSIVREETKVAREGALPAYDNSYSHDGSYSEPIENLPIDILTAINSASAVTTEPIIVAKSKDSEESAERKVPVTPVPPSISNPSEVSPPPAPLDPPSSSSAKMAAPVPVSIKQTRSHGNNSNNHHTGSNSKSPSRQNSPGLTSGSSKGGQTPGKRGHVNYCTCHYCQTFSLSLRLQRFPKYEIGMEEGLPYARSSRVLSWMNLAVYPREMIFYLTLACKWILRDAIDISGSRSIIGADTMVPLFTMVLIHARISNIHLLLYILMQYGEYDEQGDVSYNIANLEGSMQFILQMDIPNEIEERFQTTELYQSILTSIQNNVFNSQSANNNNSNKKGRQSEKSDGIASHSPGDNANNAFAASSPSSFNEHALKASFASVMTANTVTSVLSQEDLKVMDMKAMQELGEWLRDQQTMEETIAILQNDGWML